MELIVDAAQPVAADVGVDLGRRDLAVAEHKLDRPKVRPRSRRWVANECRSTWGVILAALRPALARHAGGGASKGPAG